MGTSVVPDPRGMMQGEWCASMIVSFPDDFIISPPTLDRDSWLNWARRLIEGPTFAAAGIPDPMAFPDWREWAIRVLQAVN